MSCLSLLLVLANMDLAGGGRHSKASASKRQCEASLVSISLPFLLLPSVRPSLLSRFISTQHTFAKSRSAAAAVPDASTEITRNDDGICQIV